MTLRYLLTLILCTVAFTAFASEGTVVVVVPAHDIARGAMLGESDLMYQNVPAANVTEAVVRDADALTGLEARRPLRAGEMMRASDVKRPTLVAKGATVTMLFEAPGLSLSATGRALADGGQGDSITILNTISFRQVQATVVAAGTVRVGVPGPMASVQ